MLTAGIVAGQGGSDGASVENVLGDADVVAESRPMDSWRFLPVALLQDGTKRPLDEPSPTAVPPQGRTQVAAAGEPSDVLSLASDVDGGILTPRDSDAAGAVTQVRSQTGVVSYTALGEIVAAYPWPINEAFAVVDCESRWDSLAVSWNGSSYGLFQIWQGHFWRWPNAWNEWDKPEVNTRWAWELYQESGWGIWSCW